METAENGGFSEYNALELGGQGDREFTTSVFTPYNPGYDAG
jgi:hypothetical protein